MVEAELVQNRGVDVAEMVRRLDGAEADLVGRADNASTLDAAAGHPHGKPQVVMIAALAALGFGRTSEFAAPDDERTVEQAAPFQVGQQCGDRLIGFGRFAKVVFLDVAMRVPLHVSRTAARDDTHNRTPFSTSRRASKQRRP